ncbi:MAG: Asp-tRNA(Asn)/Glu-tRNA(Gln) amidotransferase subunit GatA [Flavobacteriales bacterium]|nr:Asp-tRNA(Asn)/Glu-tRNA(Gln) amidotransferase subunit GatA [Flavobacteriales bacterium]
MESKIRKLHQDLSSQKISCEELVQGKLDELKINAQNSANFLLNDYAIEKARKVDEKIKKGEKINLLEGIPFGVKDVFLLQEQIASASSDFLKKYKSPYTATAIQKLIDAGAIPIVKENCDSFGHGSTNENSIFGAVKNANNENLVSGGSSGGSAVNVAKEYTVFSIGGDTGGSIRQPAGFNNVYGLKPSYGRVSRFGIMAYASSTDCVGPIASSTEDIAIVMNIISGKDTKDQTTFESNDINLSEKINPQSITVGYYTEFIENEGLNPKIKSDFLNVLEQLKKNNVKVKPLNFPNTEALVSTYYAVVMAETASNLARLDGSMYGNRIEADNLKESYLITRSENFTEESKRRIVGGNQVLSQGHSDDIYIKARKIRTVLTNNINDDLKQVDILISPLSPSNPPEIGNSLKNPMEMYLSDIYTVGFSLAELPTLTAPIGTDTGIQITSSKAQEELILKFTNLLNELI